MRDCPVTNVRRPSKSFLEMIEVLGFGLGRAAKTICERRVNAAPEIGPTADPFLPPGSFADISSRVGRVSRGKPQEHQVRGRLGDKVVGTAIRYDVLFAV